MASVPPPTTSAQPQPPRESSQPATPLSWEGEKMFNIYIYDYCFKRGFRKTARELLNEAEIPPEATPPINARQGLLFEWWSVFWVLFQAKSNGGGSEDALLYTQHQQQQQVRGRPIQAAPVAGQPSQPPIQRQNQVAPAMNGIPAGIPGQHQVPPGTTPMNFTMGGAPAPQPNGIAASHPPTPGSAPTQPQQHPHGPQPPNFNPILQQGQRPASMNGPQPPQPPNGQQQPQRPIGPPNSNLPFQSPAMAHSPNVQHQGPPNQQGMGAAPMGNLTGPSPLLRPGMIPQNGVQQGMVMGGVPQQPPQGGPTGGPQGQGYHHQMAGRPPSRTTTPQMQPGMMIQSSPSMGNRALVIGGQGGNAAEFSISNDLFRLPAHQLQQAKSEVGIPLEKDNAALTLNEKKRLLEFCQRRFPRPTPPVGPSMMQPPHSNLQQRPPPQLQQPPQHQGRGGKRNSASPGEEPDNMPSGSSPPDRKRPRRTTEDASMLPKGPTPSPYPPQTPQQNPAVPPPGQQQGLPPQGPPGHPQQQPPPNMMMRNMGPQPGQMQPQMTMNGQPNMMMQGQQGQPGMGGMQGGQMGPQGQMGPPAGGMVGQLGYNTTRVPLHQAHNPPGIMQGQLNAGSPAGPDPSFNPGGPNPGGPPGPAGPQFNPGASGRMLDSKPPQGRANVPPPAGAVVTPGGMMPPQSPANNAKDAQKDGKDGSPRTLGQPQNPQQPHGQPNQPIPPPSGPVNQQGPPPGTPGPQGPPQQQPQQQQQGGNQPTPGPGGPSGMPGMTPTPTNLMGGAGEMSLIGADPMLFNSAGMDFSVNPFEFGDVSSNIVDFERDFGQWFNGPNDDLASGLEMK